MTGSGLVAGSMAIAWRHLYKWVTVPANFLPTFLFPLIFFAGFAGALGRVGSVPGFDYPAPYASWIFIFSLLQTCMFGGLATGFTIAGDFSSGFAQRLLIVLPDRRALLLGYVVSTAARAVIMCIVVTVAGLVFGARLTGSPADIAAVYAIALSLSIVGTLWAAGVMFRGRSPHLAPAMQLPMFVAIFLAPVFVPIELLDGWIKVVATFNPITYVMEAERALLVGAHDGVGAALVAVACLLVVLGTWGFTGLRAAERAGGASPD